MRAGPTQRGWWPVLRGSEGARARGATLTTTRPSQRPPRSLTGLATLEASEVTRFPHFPLNFKTNQNADQHPLFVLGDQRKGKAALWVCT